MNKVFDKNPYFIFLLNSLVVADLLRLETSVLNDE